jgi:hypothetical protein
LKIRRLSDLLALTPDLLYNRVHTVTQASFDAPCIPLPGGFNSGVAGRGTNDSNPAPTWSLKITNISEPLWFFCEISTPISHCAAGMVGYVFLL